MQGKPTSTPPERGAGRPEADPAESSHRVWATADVLAGMSSPEAVVRTAEWEWAVTGTTVPPESDWTIVDDAFTRWPILIRFLDSPIGVEMSLRSGRPTGIRVRPFAPDAWIHVSARIAEGSTPVRWVARDSAGEWFVADASLPLDDTSGWLHAHGRHLIELFDDLSSIEIVDLEPNESAELDDAGARIVSKHPDSRL